MFFTRPSNLARAACLLGLLSLSLCPVTRGMADDDLLKQRAAIDQTFQDALEKIADQCDELKMTGEANVTRDWFVRRDTGRSYLFFPSDPKSAEVPKVADDRVKSWHAEFHRLRSQKADALYPLAKAAIEKRPALAYQLLFEVLRESPNHEKARRVLGFVTSYAAPQAKTMTYVHPQFDWPRGKHWRVETDHFSISTNHSAGEAVELGREVEGLYMAWRQLFFRHWSNGERLAYWFDKGGPTGRPAKHKVVLFADHKEYLAAMTKHVGETPETHGYFVVSREEVWVYVGGEVARRSAYHEVTHQLFHDPVRRGKAVGEDDSFWIVEGIALYMESFAPRETYATLGGFDSRRLQYARYWLKNGKFYLRLADLAALGQNTLQQHTNIQALYSQSAGLTHFLMDHEGGKYRENLIDYARLVYADRQKLDSLEQLTGAEFAELDAEYQASLSVSDEDLLQHLNPPDQVTTLILGQTGVTDAGLAALADYGQLVLLDLSATRITDDGLANLSKLTNLQDLWLTGTAVTDEGLTHLHNLKKLERVELTGTRVTPDGMAKLKQSLPLLEK